MQSSISKLRFGFLVLTLPFLSLVSGQCPDNLAVYDPNDRTSCINGSKFMLWTDWSHKTCLLIYCVAFFIVAVPTTAVTEVVPYKLLPLPRNDTTLFPTPFPSDKFPVVVSIYLDSDVRMSDLQLPTALLAGSIIVPFVDRLGDGKSRFLYSVRSYIGGIDGDSLSAFIPAIVGTFEGTTLLVSDFNPDSGPYQLASSPGEYTAQVKDVLVPNPVSGPGVTLEGVDTDFFTSQSSPFTTHTFHEVISQPLILNNEMCQRNPIYFNQTFTDPIFREGTVTLYDNDASAFPGVYTGVAGYSASGESVGYNAESCESAAENADPEARA